jgi:sugar phosphate isomerase/epimerase
MIGAVELSLVAGAGGPFETFEQLCAYFDAAAGAGFASVTLSADMVGAGGEGPEGVGRVAEALRQRGLRCSDLSSIVVRRDDEAALSSATSMARWAEALGARFVTGLLFTRVSDESIDRLGRCADLVEASGAQLSIEFAPTGAVESIPEALAVVERIGPSRSGVLIDSWHFCRGPSTWEDLESIPLDRIAFVQFDDALEPSGADMMAETTGRRTWPGQGTFDLERFATTLTGRGWDGLVSVEVLSAEHRRLDPATFARRAFETSRPFWVTEPA